MNIVKGQPVRVGNIRSAAGSIVGAQFKIEFSRGNRIRRSNAEGNLLFYGTLRLGV